MKIFWKILRILGAIVASLLAPALLAVLLAAPAAKTVNVLLDPVELLGTFEKLDTRELIDVSPELEKMMKEANLSPDAIEELISADITADFISLYVEDIERQLYHGAKGSSLTASDLTELVDEHSEELVRLVRKYAADSVGGKSDREIKDEITEAVEENAPKLIASLGSLEDIIGDMDDSAMRDVRDVYEFIRDDMMSLVYAAIILLSLLIFGCRAYHLEGTVWLAVIYGASSALLFSLPAVADALLGFELSGNAASAGLSVILGVISPYAVWYAVVGGIFLAAFIAVRIIYAVKKKKARKPAPASIPSPAYTPTPAYTPVSLAPAYVPTPAYTAPMQNVQQTPPATPIAPEAPAVPEAPAEPDAPASNGNEIE